MSSILVGWQAIGLLFLSDVDVGLSHGLQGVRWEAGPASRSGCWK